MLFRSNYIYTSTDSGITWTKQMNAGSRNWTSVASSADGTKLAAGVSNGYIYTSTDSGVTWIERTTSGARYWKLMVSSSDGIKLAAVVDSSYIYTSNDSGATWTQRTSAGSRDWRGIASSAYGNKLAAAPYGTNIYTSSDSGATWVAENVTSAWHSIASSSDGNKIVGFPDGYVVTKIPSSSPTLTTQAYTPNTSTSAILNGTITDLGGASATVRGFQYGLDTNYGTNTTENGTFNIGAYTASITGLSCGITYHYRSYATNGAGTGYGTDQSFVPTCPTLATLSTDGVSSTTGTIATLNGTVTNNGNDTITTRGFQYGLDTNYGTTTTETGSFSAGEFSANITSLTAGTVYHYRAYATNSVGTVYGSDVIFTSLPYYWKAATSVGSRNWRGLASSSDGTKLAAVVNGGYIYTSTDSGVTWTERQGAGSRQWWSIASSSDGTKLAVSDNGGYIYTLSPSIIPTVGTQNSYSRSTQAGLNGNIIDTGGVSVTVRGFQYGTDTNYGTNTTENGTFNAGSYQATITSLTCGTTYHFRSYATNTIGTGYGTDQSFTPACPTIPSVTTDYEYTDGPNYAYLGGNIVSDGNDDITVSGFEYGTDTNYGNTTTDGPSYDVYSWESYVSDLSCGTTYHYRSYATNSYGTGYGEDKTFKTWNCPAAPDLTTDYEYGNSPTDAYLGGTITSDNLDYVQVSGFEYGTDTNYGNTTYDGPTYFDGTGQYSQSMESYVSDLSCGTTYHYRSYATNSYGTGYGEDKTFKTWNCPAIATLTTDSAHMDSASNAYLDGTIVSDNSSYIQKSGFEYGIDTNYGNTTYDGPTWYDGTGQYSQSMESYISDLSCGTTYHYRSYAMNDYGTGYGEDKTFTTWNCPAEPTVTTDITNIYSSSYVGLVGTIVSDNTDYVQASGFEYGMEDFNNKETKHDKISDGPTYFDGTGQVSQSWESYVNGLTCGATYYYRAFANNNYGTGYGEVKTFVADCPIEPTVITDSVNVTSVTEATLSGTISSDGRSNIVQSGFEYGTDTNYGNTTYDGPTKFDGTGQVSQSWESSITDLNWSTLYHYRAYATNEYGLTGYGEDKTFITNDKPSFDLNYPTENAGGVTAIQISDSQSSDLGKVQISYSVMDRDTSLGTVNPGKIITAFEYSFEGDDTWNNIKSRELASGDTDLKDVTPDGYTTYTATWDAHKVVNPTNKRIKIRVTANDNEPNNNIAQATTEYLSIDTTAPILPAPISFDAGVAGVVNSASIYIPKPDGVVYYRITDDSKTQTNPADTDWVEMTDNTTIPWTFDSDIEAKSINYQFKDEYNNETPIQTLTTAVPVPVASFGVQDTSDTSNGTYDLYLGWKVSTDNNFSSYKLEYATSEDGENYGDYSNIESSSFSNINTNYFTFKNLDSNLYYRLRISVVNTDGYISIRSKELVAKPDGIQNYDEGGSTIVATPSKVNNVIVSQNEDKTVTINYRLTDASITRKKNPSYEAYVFYNTGITFSSISDNKITLSDGSKLQSSGYIMIGNEVIKYTNKKGNTIKNIIRGTWPDINTTGRLTRTTPELSNGTPIWILANNTNNIAITNDSISSGQDGTISWNTYSEPALAGYSYPNTGIKVVVHDNQDALSGPLSNQNDFSENGVLNNLDLTAPAVSFNETSNTGDESVTPVEITLNLARMYPLDTTVNYTVTGTATNGSDYTLDNGTATIIAGNTSTTIELPITDDTLKELDETVILTLSNPTNAILGTNTEYTYTIVDNDQSGTIQFGSTESSGEENITSVDIPVTLSEASGADTTVNYSVTGGTATNGSDYNLQDGTVTIPAGEISTNITLPIINDVLKEDSETITIELSNPTNATLGANTTFTYTIIDDDLLPTLGFTQPVSQAKEDVNTVDIPVSISAPYAEDVTFNYTASGTATGNGVDYLLTEGPVTIKAGDTTANIHLVVFDDTLAEDTETVILTLTDPTNANLGTNSIHAFSILDNEIAVTKVAGNEIKSTSAVITWSTADFADTKIDYGTIAPDQDGAYGLSKSKDEKVLDHNIYLGNLTPSTTYYFRTTSVNLAGETTTSDSQFTTTSGPVITNVSSNTITDTGVTITWTTDLPSDSYVVYSPDSTFEKTKRFGTADIVTEHTVTLTGLNSEINYYYKVESTDETAFSGEDANNGNYYTFTTGQDMTPPSVTDISVPIITATQAAVIWKTNEPADGKVMYGTTSGSYTDSTELITTKITDHIAAISNLAEATTYYYVVMSSDQKGNSTTTPEQSFKTTTKETVVVTTGGGMVGVAQQLYDILLAENEANKAKLKDYDSTTPVVSDVQVTNVTAFGATVSFVTSADTVAFVDYGKDTEYGLMVADKEWSKTHTIKFYGLSLGTEYNFKINAMNKSNTLGYSDNQKFTTKFLTEDLAQLQKIDNVEQFQKEIEKTIESILPSLVPPFIDKPVVSDITESTATISFRTNIKAFPVVSYTADETYDATKTNPYDGQISDTANKDVTHTLTLIGLKSNTKYHVMVKAFSIPQVIGKSEDFTFTTTASKIAGSIIDVKKDSFTVVWTTDQPTTSIVEYKNMKTGRIARIVDDVKNSSHSMKIENLTPGTLYEVTISGINDKGNLVEGNGSLNTKTSTDNVPPVISNIKLDNALVVGRTDRVQTIVSWQTDEPSTSTVYYEEGSGSPTAPLANKQEDLTLTKNHVVILTVLKPGTVYRFTVDSTDDANNMSKPPIRTIITPKKIESIVDVISKNFSETFNFMNNVR